MAEIWFVDRGDEPTHGDAPYTLPLSDCIARLELKQSDYLCDLENTPRFGPPTAQDGFAGPRYVVVEVTANEASAMRWKAGFYGPLISVLEARRVLTSRTR